jgi:GntR family transcriptional regulator/MocR family aminotransferase
VEDELRDAIRSGRLPSGTRLPSTRALAADLGVTRGLVVAAYDQLLAEGYVVAVPGSGTVVSDTAPAPATTAPASAVASTTRFDFRPGLPDLELFPRAAWGRAARVALATLPTPDLGYIDPRGLPALRAALADYLGRVRGVSTHPDQVVLCDGFTHGFSLLAPVLAAAGHEDVAVEDPGHHTPREQLEAVGARVHPVEVDDGGLVVSRLRDTSARAVVLTPAHQYPTGAVLSARRRTELAAWARHVDGYIVEDDYDAEYRYDRHPIGAIQGVAPERVIYAGTLSKSLAPGLRLGWLVLPPELVAPVVAARRLSGIAGSSLLQATFHRFLGQGDLDRHLRRTRRIYRHRRDGLLAALARHLPDARPDGVAAGLHVLVSLPAGTDEHRVVTAATAAGVAVEPLSQSRLRRRAGQPAGLVLGYGSLTPTAADDGVAALADAVRAGR